MPTKVWTCQHDGHEIKVENYWNLILWCRERLFIDGKLADEQQAWVFFEPRFSVNLFGKIKQPDGSLREVKVLIGQAKWGFTNGCKVWVDSELVFPEGV